MGILFRWCLLRCDIHVNAIKGSSPFHAIWGNTSMERIRVRFSKRYIKKNRMPNQLKASMDSTTTHTKKKKNPPRPEECTPKEVRVVCYLMHLLRGLSTSIHKLIRRVWNATASAQKARWAN
ncbi:hypothetical protein TRVL_06192 [Trypanosoma vivax]|nr:hypothetical protein TRVL_06192 [Trypanosoma vivax]